MKRIKKTKIIATLGPSSSTADCIEKLIKEGVDVLRINFSHSSHQEAEILINTDCTSHDVLCHNSLVMGMFCETILKPLVFATELQDGKYYVTWGSQITQGQKGLKPEKPQLAGSWHMEF